MKNPFSFILLTILLSTIIASAKTQAPSPQPSPPSSELQENQLNNIFNALIGAGDFTGWASILSSKNPSNLPISATIFMPSNDAVSHLPSSNSTGVNSDSLLIPYHIVPQRLTFSDLLKFSIGTRLPTLLPSKFIVVTSNSRSNFSVDGVKITHPDVFLNGVFSVQGIDSVLDYSGSDGGIVVVPVPDNGTYGVVGGKSEPGNGTSGALGGNSEPGNGTSGAVGGKSEPGNGTSGTVGGKSEPGNGASVSGGGKLEPEKKGFPVSASGASGMRSAVLLLLQIFCGFLMLCFLNPDLGL